MNNEQYKEVMRNYKEMTDGNATSIRYVFHIDVDGFYVSRVVLDFCTDNDVAGDFNPKDFIKIVFPVDGYDISYDYYEVARDYRGEVALVKYLHDVPVR